MRDGEAQVDGSGRFAGIFACDLPDAPGLRLVAGACAADGAAARALIAARLAKHGVTAVQCEALMPCEDWAAAYPGDTQGARLEAALRRTGQVSFLDHLVALPQRRQTPATLPDAACLRTVALDDVTPLGPGDMAEVPAALADLFDPADGAQCYAVLDAAAAPLLPELIETSGLAHRCLFQGEAAEALRRAAPWLVRLEAGNDFTRDLFSAAPEGATAPRKLWGRIQPILLRSADGMDRLAAHFRRLTRVRAEAEGDGRWLYFRFYDARTLDLLRPVLAEADARALLGSYEFTAVAPEGSRRYALARPAGHGDNAPRTPFVMRDAYLRAMRGQMTVRFRDRLAGDIARANPALTPEAAQGLADEALDFCEGVALLHQDSIAGYGLLSAHLGRDFLHRFASLAPIADPRHPERDRKTMIHRALAEV